MRGQSYPLVDLSIIGKLNDFKARVDALPAKLAAQVSYKKIGGLHFVKIGKLSGSFSVKRAKPVIKRDNAPLAPPSVAVIDAARLSRFVR